jgi:hypothetical protein
MNFFTFQLPTGSRSACMGASMSARTQDNPVIADITGP